MLVWNRISKMIANVSDYSHIPRDSACSHSENLSSLRVERSFLLYDGIVRINAKQQLSNIKQQQSLTSVISARSRALNK